MSSHNKLEIPDASEALPGRDQAIVISGTHAVLGTTMKPPFSENLRQAIFGLGCFWGAERVFWNLSGVITTAVGYTGGITPNPNYEEVCSGLTGHNEVVLVVFDPDLVSYQKLVQIFFEAHDPTQGMRQGNDQGTQYRSGIYTFESEQKSQAATMLEQFSTVLAAQGYGEITTEIVDSPIFYYAEEYHQQYLAKNPNGYCGLGGTEVKFPVSR